MKVILGLHTSSENYHRKLFTEKLSHSLKVGVNDIV